MAAERRDLARRRCQLRIGLLPRSAVEFFLAVAQLGVEHEHVAFLLAGPEDESALELFSMVGNKGVL